MQYPLYGSTLFPAQYRGYWTHGTSLVLGINPAGVLLLKPVQDNSVLFQFAYREIESILLDPNENFVTMTLLKDGSDRQRVFVLETSAKNEVNLSICNYVLMYIYKYI